MKKILLLATILFSFTSSILSQNIEEIMQSGNLAFQNKKYSEAITQYESIIKQGYVSSELFYNLGNAYFKSNSLGKAILYYEKSLKLSPLSEDAKYNLKIANSRTVDKIKVIPKLFIFEWWDIILTSFTSTGWQIIVIIFYVFLLLSIGVYFLIKNIQLQRIAFIFGLFNIAAFIFAVILFSSHLSRTSSSNYGILQSSVISAKISPDERSNDAFVIHEGSKILIEDKVNNWVKIKLADGKVGWLPDSSFESI
ncbi:MAG: tetratricopeptide repeat protein [Ignavibacteriae bacterium]|nr:tetratricopeptide repeat protein [Ignavibacteriota bacterium]